MKHTKLFNNHNEYIAYTASTSFYVPNVSWCIQEEEAHCTPAGEQCTEQHEYSLIGEPSYPSNVDASATTFNLVFEYSESYTAVTCQESVRYGTDAVPIYIGENETFSARTINGSYEFNGIYIPYTLTQDGQVEKPYSERYLTFDILTGGTVMWVARNGVAKTISYSINDGEWTSITATTGGTPINVSAGDKVRFKGTNEQYATAKDTCSCFSGGTAYYNIEGNIMSLIGGDNFINTISFGGKTWVFHDLFSRSKAVSAKNLVLPVMTLTNYCYRALFSKASDLEEAPELPATTLAEACYWYMFDVTKITKAPELPAATLAKSCYRGMFENCNNLNYIKCLATNGITTSNCSGWTLNVSSTGTFVKDASASSWAINSSDGIPSGWTVIINGTPDIPTIDFDGKEIELSCETQEANIYYQLNNSGNYVLYDSVIRINADTFIEAYSEKNGIVSNHITQNCVYDTRTQYEYSNEDLTLWTYGNNTVTLPYSVNAIDGHSRSYSKGKFDFSTSVNLRKPQPTYLWFQHADQSSTIYVNDTQVEKHWGGYNAFFTDITNYVNKGTNNIKVAIKNNEGDNLAPAAGDFNFNATLGKVKLFTSPYIPSTEYGYDGFHITSTVSSASATINVKTLIPSGATVVCKIDDGNTNIFSATSASTNEEMVFTTTISNPHLWSGTIDPHLYTVTLEIYHDNELYHRYVRPYGLRYYEYVINDTTKYGTVGNPYTGFLLNGQAYLLRGVCIHDDLVDKANALSDSDYTQEFNIIQELKCNFLRLAHYPHPKEVYDKCDQLGIIVQTEVPCVNKMQSTMPNDYYSHLNTQYSDMVKQHYNHPCIMFWGLSNEAVTDDSSFAKTKVEGYTSLIKSIDSERLVGYVVSHSIDNPSSYFGNPNVDWFGCNIYVGWYIDKTTNDPSNRLNTRIANTITSRNKPLAFTEYGCGGTSTCHSDDFMTTTVPGNNPRHDIEYQMWLHEGHIASIKNYPQLMFTAQWQLFDIAVSNRDEGYIVCLDGINETTDSNLKYLNNKGLVERDHVTKKDTFYLYKAWWNQTDKFVHICQKNYEKVSDRVIKCYTNETGTLTMYVNGVSAATATVTDNIALFAARNFNDGDTIMVSGATTNDTFTIKEPKFFCKLTLSDTSTVNITGSGALTSGNTSSYSATCVSAEIGKLCTSLGNNAFYQFDYLTAVTLSDTITSIGYRAFYGCGNLTGCSIPDSVTSIGDSAFNGCDSLTTVRMPSGLTSISDYCFIYCDKLSSINIPSGITSIGNYAFNGCWLLPNIQIPSGVTSIGWNAFTGCRSFTNVVIPSGVTEIESETFSSCSGLTSVTIPSSVTSIGSWAFSYCTSLTNVTIPNSVTNLSSRAFYACSGLTSITIPSGVTSIGNYAFQYSSGLTSITVSAATPPTLGSAAFDNTNNCPIYVPCDNIDAYKAATNWSTYSSRMQEIPGSCSPTITAKFNVTSTTSPTQIGYDEYISGFTAIEIDGVTQQNVVSAYTFSTTGEHTVKYTLTDPTSVGDYAFNQCSSLTSVTMPNSVTSIGERAFRYCTNLSDIVIPSGVTSIDADAFYDCVSLTGTMTIPSGVTVIESGVFQYCSGITNVILPSGVTSIGINAFATCTSLSSITIPDSVTYIGVNSFYNCTSLTSINIPSGVTFIGTPAFSNCDSLTSITVDSNNSTYSSDNGVLFNKSKTTLLQYPGGKAGTSYSVPNSVTKIGNNSFNNCKNITSVIMPNSVTSIGDSAFAYCINLSNVNIPNSVTLIEYYGFGGCTSLSSITIPSSVAKIGAYVFEKCSSLTSITSLRTTAPTIQDSTFRDVHANGTLTVPQGSSGYDTWMQNQEGYLGYYNWTKIEQ